MSEATGIPSADVSDAIGHEPNQLGIKAPKFVRCTKYPTFAAEVTIIDDDFVFHFYMPRGEVTTAYYHAFWEGNFPKALDQVAQEYFRASAPRLQAAHINELGIDSWWMRARGFASQSLSPDSFIDGFYAALHEALVSLNVK